MVLKSLVLFCLCAGFSQGIVYDSYTGKIATDEQISFYRTYGFSENCTIDVDPCDENEGRRTDASCNNLKFPAGGTYNAPMPRILPPVYHNGFHQRLAKSGKALPLARLVRTHLLKEGKSKHYAFNHNVPGFGIHMWNDVGSVHDAENMLIYYPHCCEPEHMNDIKCTPNIIPEDDPVHRFSGIRCMNSTRPITYQEFNCTTDAVPSPVKKATSVFDSSQIYNEHNKGEAAVRSYKDGMLTVEEEDGKLFPPNGPDAFCPNNVGDETRCFENHVNTLLPTTLYTVWCVRNHNYNAMQLKKVNPCWDDQKLFTMAREISIAQILQMYLYEWIVAVEGRENAINAGIITKDGGFRDLYDDTKYPEVTVEYSLLFRWFHLLQEGTAKLYDRQGNYLKDYPLFNTTFRVGFLAKDDNMAKFAQSTFRAPCHGRDKSVDFDIAGRAFPNVQLAIDAPAGDLNKIRHVGLPPYIDYVKHFTGFKITCFEDLVKYKLMTKESVELIKDVYDHCEDLDVLAGMWLEENMEGGHIPFTFACVINDNMVRAIKSDRHWYERPNKPNALTAAQLYEIRKYTLSRFLCNNADGIDEIPVNAFLNICSENPLVPCKEIPEMDYTAWADPSCNEVCDD